MKAHEFYSMGKMVRSSVDRLLPEELRQTLGLSGVEDEQDQVPDRGTNAASPQPTRPRQQPRTQPAEQSQQRLNEYDYDYRVVDQIIKQFTDAGYDPRFAVGMAANAIAESNLVPSAFNADEDAFGLFQWRNDRVANLEAFIDRTGKNINDTNAQIAFSIKELQTWQNSAYQQIMRQDPQSAAEYAGFIDDYYERSSGAHRKKRMDIAAQLYRDYYGEDGRAQGEMLSFSTEDVPITEEGRAKTRDEVMRDYMSSEGLTGPTGGKQDDEFFGTLHMGRAEVDDTPASRVFTDTTNTLPYDPGTVDNSPTGGDPTPPVTQPPTQPPVQGDMVPQTGIQKDGWEGAKDIFRRRENEGDEEFRDRRRAMMLAAAEGFQMLSRGVKADFMTPVQMRLQERDARFTRKYNLSEQDRKRREFAIEQHRLERAQQLAQNKFNFDTQTYQLDKLNELQRRDAITMIAQDAGLSVAAELARTGEVDAAVDMLTAQQKEQLKTKPESTQFRLPDDSGRAFTQRMEAMNRPDLAAPVAAGLNGDEDYNPEAAEEAYKQGIRLANEVDADSSGLEQALVDMIPSSATPKDRQTLEASAQAAASSGSETVLSKYFDQIRDVANRDSLASTTVSAIVEADNEDYLKVISGSRQLRTAATSAMDIAIAPNFQSGKLRETFLTPLARYIRDLPGGEKVAEQILGVDSTDVAGSILLNAINNGQMGNLARNIDGQLSNMEGEKIRAMLADGSLSRVEILALSQMMRRMTIQNETRHTARLKYLRSIGTDNDFSIDEYNRVQDEAVAQVAFFERMTPKARIYMQDALLEEYNVDDSLQLPAHVAGMVVSELQPDGGIELVPVFAEMYPDEFGGFE